MTTIKFRRDTSANWTSVNPIPAQGEPCYETDTGKLKIGNGSDNYVTLPYVSDGGGGSAGTTDYTQLENKPQINSVELAGNKTLNDLGIQPKGNYLTALPDNAVTTDTTQTISGSKTFTRSITTASIYPSDEITFNSTSQSRYINNIDSISGGYHSQNGYLTLKGDTTLVGDNKLILNGRTGGLKLTAASSSSITCENDLIAPNIITTANGTIKLTHPMSVVSGTITLNNNYGQLSISSSSEGNNNLLGITRGTTYALIDGDAITTKDKDGNLHYYINSQNIDTTYMKWDTSTGKLKVDTAAVAHLAMPSSGKVKLTLGANNTTYTSPTDGYFTIIAQTTAENGSLSMFSNDVYNYAYNPYENAWFGTFVPSGKDGVTTIQYSNINPTVFAFVYAVGSAPTNT